MATNNDDENLSGYSNMPVVDPPNPKFVNTTSGQLLVLVGNKSNLNQAKDACTELHRRYVYLVMGWCWNHLKFLGIQINEIDFTQAVNDAFVNVYLTKSTFIMPSNLSPAQQEAKVISWLITIVLNIIKTNQAGLKKQPKISNSPDIFQFLVKNEPNKEQLRSSRTPRERQLVREFIKNCKPIDQAILLTQSSYWSPSTGQIEMDEEVRKNLCNEFNLDDAGLRVRRNRVMNRLRNYIIDNLN